ncbi:MAG: hypothetical protein A2Y03_07920 [Omnitrophica WOR_2 bacterium GWF2_38_59]|nr:MAG: hypothetical protein A2Y06_07935 [Omnitrophica WOR_2 bacterium GWA2_37_7]OGX24461.1 MAG: hypothetical protein A2Y03_07920 [Omnitrophica WOR_2 bacterium GWF2_38_59]OGX50397.1 MAG: hypothetical protein A2243_02300 [Omnitrophica WOR_2 bacterium RIFOXYA2_FULL_38_17]OGX58610.1 MAG: hypothetical protein A2447_00365 [Omnitrophica WOR_2 bacterium RIFOXYC2_FULL_38_12]OGX60381.1 MAG: hypothetical protein A2306_00730 [Omnitrophica WOR_2 bacterium RIFOXYB2_FULL_38_16]HBG61144.1 hypothetical protei
MADFVVVKYFLNRHYAGLAQGLLGDGNVESFIDADDCGGLRQGMSIGRIRLLVPDFQLERAKELLEVLDVEQE